MPARRSRPLPQDLAEKWCDLGCPHAAFPTKTALEGACHTLRALWCRRHRRLVPKNGTCLDRIGR